MKNHKILLICCAICSWLPLNSIGADKFIQENEKAFTQIQEDDDAFSRIKTILSIKEDLKTTNPPLERTEISEYPDTEKWTKFWDQPVVIAKEEEPSFMGKAFKRFTYQNGKALITQVNDFALETTSRASNLMVGAISFLGVPYKFGGESVAQGFDCSSFVRHVFQTTMGFTLPRLSQQQAKDPNLQVVAKNNLAPGDLVFFNTRHAINSHVGMYLGNMNFIHAPRTGKSIEIESMNSDYWKSRFTGARRVAVKN